jgi:predicted metal-dependent hydrolase
MRELNVFGKVEFVRSSRAHRITVKILPDGLRVSMPSRSNEAFATQFILQNQASILSKQARIRAKRLNTLITPEQELKTRTFTVKAKFADRADVFFNLRDGVLQIEIPEEADIRSEEVQQVCWNGINYFLKKEAKNILPDQVKTLAAQYGFKYTGVKIQSSKTRWGSCSRTQNINLSFYLMLLPPHLADYVILHELCHTLEMNHGERFWKLMDEVTGGKTKKLRIEMKRYAIP